MLSKSKISTMFQQSKRLQHTDNNTLILLHTIFRHGDRTPDLSSSYPNDPYKNHNYHPYGHGQLTNAGKRRAYNLGEFLRTRYSSFLGHHYVPEQVDALASDFDRTKMTLQLVLAGLYPPVEHQVWLPSLGWQPIPYRVTPSDRDMIFLAFMHNREAVDRYWESVRGVGKEILRGHEDVIRFVEEKSCRRIDCPRDMFAIACTLATQEAMGLELPEWTKDVWPLKIEEVAMKEFDILVSDVTLKSLVIGGLFKKIIDDTHQKISGKSQTKIHLYSGHDFTVGLFLRVLDLFDPHHPDFCSAVILELHKIDGQYGFKVVYKCGENDGPRELVIPKLSKSFCSFNQFKELTQDMLNNLSSR